MTLKRNGNVGIGTKMPNSMLEVGTGLPFTGKLIRAIGSSDDENAANIEIGNGDAIYWRLLRLSNNTFRTSMTGSWSILGNNVGIGTPSPQSKLEVGTNSLFTGKLIRAVGHSHDESAANLEIGDGGSIYWRLLHLHNKNFRTTMSKPWEIIGANVAIGGTNPKAKLDVNGNITFKNTLPPVGNNHSSISFPYGPVHIRNATSGASPGGQALAIDLPHPGAFEVTQIGKGPVAHIKSDGDAHFEGKVTAKGGFRSGQSSWPDHVFQKDFKLRSLDAVEEFILENKHLPDIPSEKEITQNGLLINDMLSKQMQKIEELTLYLIELKKENNSLKTENEQIEKRLLTIEALVNS